MDDGCDTRCCSPCLGVFLPFLISPLLFAALLRKERMFSASRTSLTSETSSNPQSSSSSLENGVPSNSEVVTPPSPSSPLSLSSLLDSNPLFSAGFGLMIFGSVLALSRKGLTLAASTAQRRLLISLEIPSKDKSHPWFLHWMGEQAKAQSMRQAGLLGGVKREFL